MAHILNRSERAALSALREGWIATEGVSALGLSRQHFETLHRLGLAMVAPSGRSDRRVGYAISEDGWRCIYGFSKAQLDSLSNIAPAPFRVWQWPLAEHHRTVAA
jgi:hypothetical protein